MIPRKEAKKLLEEFVGRLNDDDEESGITTTYGVKSRAEHAADLLRESDLVLRGAENVEQKARRYLTEGRITVVTVAPNGLIVAEARGSSGEPYHLGYDPRNSQWRCTCGPAGRKGNCSHVKGLRLVTTTTTGGTA